MSKQDILTKGIPQKVLTYLDKVDDFDLDDYKLLVSNSISNTQYFIYLIKFKFRLLPDISVLLKANKYWYKNLIQFINLDITQLYDILYENIQNDQLHIDDKSLAMMITNMKGTLNTNELLELLIQHKYINSIVAIFDSNLYKLKLTDQQIDSLLDLKINIGKFELYYETVNGLIKSINTVSQIQQNTIGILNLQYDGCIQNHHIKLNEYLFQTKDDYTYLFSKLLKSGIHLTTSCIPKQKKRIYPELLKHLVFHNDIKLFKYYHMFPQLYKDCNILTCGEFENLKVNINNTTLKKDMEDNFKLIKNYIGGHSYIYQYSFTIKYQVIIRALLYKYHYNNIDIKDIYNKISALRPTNTQRQQFYTAIITDLKKLIL